MFHLDYTNGIEVSVYRPPLPHGFETIYIPYEFFIIQNNFHYILVDFPHCDSMYTQHVHTF